MKRFLVALDGSAPALRALRYATHLASRLRGELHVVNVQPRMPLYGVVRATMDSAKYHAACEALANKALAPAARLLGRARVKHRLHVRFGEPAATIAAAARELKCTAVVTGTRGLGAVGGLVLGSTATKIVHLARVPVILVK